MKQAQKKINESRGFGWAKTGLQSLLKRFDSSPRVHPDDDMHVTIKTKRDPYGYNSYQEAYIDLKKAVSAMKRCDVSDCQLDILGYTSEEYACASEYMVAERIERKERAELIKTIKKRGVNIYDVERITLRLNEARMPLQEDGDNQYLLACECILGNLLYNRDEKVREIYETSK